MYSCLKKAFFEDKKGYKIVPLREKDMEQIRLWRNAQIDVLRQKKPITEEEQKNYYQTIVKPEFSKAHPSQILFSYLYEEECIGYGGLTYIDWENRRAEISFLINPEFTIDPNHYKQDFCHYLGLICCVAFEELKLHRIYTETFAFRAWHMAVLEHCGFKHEGTLRDHVYKRDRWVDSWMHGLLAQEHFYAP